MEPRASNQFNGSETVSIRSLIGEQGAGFHG
jgi:hypothetical protein